MASSLKWRASSSEQNRCGFYQKSTRESASSLDDLLLDMLRSLDALSMNSARPFLAVGFVILSSEESSRVGINTGTEKQLQCDSHASVASASQHSRSSVAWKPRTNHSRSFESNSSQPASPPSQQRNTEKVAPLSPTSHRIRNLCSRRTFTRTRGIRVW